MDFKELEENNAAFPIVVVADALIDDASLEKEVINYTDIDNWTLRVWNRGEDVWCILAGAPGNTLQFIYGSVRIFKSVSPSDYLSVASTVEDLCDNQTASEIEHAYYGFIKTFKLQKVNAVKNFLKDMKGKK